MAGDSDRVPLEVSQPHLKEFLAFLPELNKELDRGMVLIATSFIDELLLRTIKAFLVKGSAADALLDGFNAPLGTFSARIAAATALGLLHEAEARDADKLRKVRNCFAHNVHVSFQDQSVRDLCFGLELAAQNYPGVTVDARGRFSTGSVSIISNLTNRPHYAGLEHLKSRVWRI